MQSQNKNKTKQRQKNLWCGAGDNICSDHNKVELRSSAAKPSSWKKKHKNINNNNNKKETCPYILFTFEFI